MVTELTVHHKPTLKWANSQEVDAFEKRIRRIGTYSAGGFDTLGFPGLFSTKTGQKLRRQLGDLSAFVFSSTLLTFPVGKLQSAWLTLVRTGDIEKLKPISDSEEDYEELVEMMTILVELLDDDEVDLIASPSISGYITGEIVAGNSAIGLETSSLIFEEGNTHKTVGKTVPGGPTETSVSLQNMQYHMEFLTDWDLELNLTDTVNYFVEDKSFHLGTFPEITWSSDEDSVDASVTTGFDNPVIMAVVNDVPTDTTGTSTTEPETSTTGPGSAMPPSLGDMDPMLLLMGVVAAGGITLVAVLALVIKKCGS